MGGESPPHLPPMQPARLPSHVAGQVSYHLMPRGHSYPDYVIFSKNVKFRQSRNSTKFNWGARFREMIPTVQSVLSSEIYKNPNFSSGTISANYRFAIFSEKFKFKFFTGFTDST